MTVGIAWYDKAQWELLRAMAADPEGLDDSFEKWEANAVSTECELRANGIDTERVFIVVRAWADWCRRTGKPLTSASRSQYAAHKLKRRHST